MDIAFLPLLVAIAFFLLVFWINSRIVCKAGFSRWWALLSFVPLVNLVMVWVFAFARWPRLEDNARQP